MVVLAALRARLKGWVPSGKYTLGNWGLAVNIAALTYGVIAMINMAWPRTPDLPWYDNWIVPLSAVVVVGIGLDLHGRPSHLRPQRGAVRRRHPEGLRPNGTTAPELPPRTRPPLPSGDGGLVVDRRPGQPSARAVGYNPVRAADGAALTRGRHLG